MKKVGVLALQGDYEAHQRALLRAGALPDSIKEIRTAAELAAVDGLVIPGGESTTMLRLLNRESLFEPLRQFGQTKPIFGTCAGAILLATTVTSPEQESLHLMDISVQRNAYGRQLDSRVVQLGEGGDGDIDKAILAEGANLEAVFIRAPIIRGVGPAVKVLATYQGTPVLAEQGLHLVATFHPELTSDPRVHAYFLEKIEE